MGIIVGRFVIIEGVMIKVGVCWSGNMTYDVFYLICFQQWISHTLTHGGKLYEHAWLCVIMCKY